jgi:uncharacterized protein with von Willebrand factor type A (vWA) domain
MSTRADERWLAEHGALPDVASSEEAADTGQPLTPGALVILLDMSRSMFLHGCATAAKESAITLSSLIRRRYSQLTVYIVLFSYYAREIAPEDLPHQGWKEWGYGTNMQHAFMYSRYLLARHQGGTRQIILLTDGEQTAYFDGDHIEFRYPPDAITIGEALREVEACTREQIVINTCMLGREASHIEFVQQMTKINHGRALYTTPERLPQEIVDSLSTFGLDDEQSP